MQYSTGKVDSNTPIESSRMHHATMESTESGPARKAAELALDLLRGLHPQAQQVLPAPYIHSHTTSCFQHVELFKAKLNTLNTLHQTGLCHGSVNSQHFFPSRTNKGFYDWMHADTTAFHENTGFDQWRLIDFTQAAAEHLPHAHTEAVLEQAPVKKDLEELTNLMNILEAEDSAKLPDYLSRVTNEYSRLLEQEGFNFGDNQGERSNSWIQGMNSEVVGNITIYSHPSDTDHPKINEWRIPKQAADHKESLCQKLDNEFKQQAHSPSGLLAWTHFEENNHDVIRAAFYKKP